MKDNPFMQNLELWLKITILKDKKVFKLIKLM